MMKFHFRMERHEFDDVVAELDKLGYRVVKKEHVLKLETTFEARDLGFIRPSEKERWLDHARRATVNQITEKLANDLLLFAVRERSVGSDFDERVQFHVAFDVILPPVLENWPTAVVQERDSNAKTEEATGEG